MDNFSDGPASNLRSKSCSKLSKSTTAVPESMLYMSPAKRRKSIQNKNTISSNGSLTPKLNQMQISSPAKKSLQSQFSSPKLSKKNTETKSTKNMENLKIAAKQLHGSAIPEVLVSRDVEFSQIEQFIVSQLKTLAGGCLYVSGVPGSGKTATVTKVIRQCKKDNPSRLNLLEVNCMNITEPKQIYSLLQKAIFGKKTNPKTALENLIRHFSTQGEAKWPKLFLVLDEMDLLWTRRQDVLYNMFDWPSQSSLAVIAISNTLDLPERLLSHRVASRLGPNRVSFKPYLFSELKSIVLQRVKDLNIFEDEAVEFASRKVSSVSGDARSILSVCRRLIEARLLSLEGNLNGKCSKIGIRDMNDIFAQIHNSPKISAIRNSSTLERIALRSLMNAQRSLSVDHVPMHDLYTHFVDGSRTEGHQYGTSHSQFMNLVLSLAASRLIIVEDARHGNCKSVVSLNVSFDDVLLALF